LGGLAKLHPCIEGGLVFSSARLTPNDEANRRAATDMTEQEVHTGASG